MTFFNSSKPCAPKRVLQKLFQKLSEVVKYCSLFAVLGFRAELRVHNLMLADNINSRKNYG
jgi:hypothetical protein